MGITVLTLVRALLVEFHDVFEMSQRCCIQVPSVVQGVRAKEVEKLEEPQHLVCEGTSHSMREGIETLTSKFALRQSRSPSHSP